MSKGRALSPMRGELDPALAQRDGEWQQPLMHIGSWGRDLVDQPLPRPTDGNPPRRCHRYLAAGAAAAGALVASVSCTGSLPATASGAR
ncbi:hypothetical protein San01_17400 [Streptomyces angustmyceticus]|uniref:Uncharacterized protein n=1 Tax=Streptomyces angustmyceticus TaxID=285578 RepID=A0A5J4L5A6_9ACTN|nr:hypothetical protein San01_17400 [Streptomyces angustmyceticus]